MILLFTGILPCHTPPVRSYKTSPIFSSSPQNSFNLLMFKEKMHITILFIGTRSLQLAKFRRNTNRRTGERKTDTELHNIQPANCRLLRIISFSCRSTNQTQTPLVRQFFHTIELREGTKRLTTTLAKYLRRFMIICQFTLLSYIGVNCVRFP